MRQLDCRCVCLKRNPSYSKINIRKRSYVSRYVEAGKWQKKSLEESDIVIINCRVIYVGFQYHFCIVAVSSILTLEIGQSSIAKISLAHCALIVV